MLGALAKYGDIWNAWAVQSMAELTEHRAKVDEAECDESPPGLPGEDPSFSTAVTALGAKLAKADGEAQSSEYDAFQQRRSLQRKATQNELSQACSHGDDS